MTKLPSGMTAIPAGDPEHARKVRVPALQTASRADQDTADRLGRQGSDIGEPALRRLDGGKPAVHAPHRVAGRDKHRRPGRHRNRQQERDRERRAQDP